MLLGKFLMRNKRLENATRREISEQSLGISGSSVRICIGYATADSLGRDPRK